MRRIDRKWKRPRVPYDAARIKAEDDILKSYGLRRKREIWRAEAIIRGLRERARKLIAEKDREKEKILLGKLAKMGLLKEGSVLDNVLALKTTDILNRRLETIIFNKGLVQKPLQARQIITHGHVYVAGVRTYYPSYLVSPEEEAAIEIRYPPKQAQQAAAAKMAEENAKPEAAEVTE
ncbi:MAG: 30S ribosomal protein S4 [Candidatus Aenigmarchaeota archaeon]|nr:30S ribosomal protein S4 [Candidatus Aenigmarchaeota archaeon]